MSVVDVSLSEDSGFEITPKKEEAGSPILSEAERKKAYYKKRASHIGDLKASIPDIQPGSGLQGDPLLNLDSAQRWLEDSAYDVRITAVIMLTLVVSIGFYAVTGIDFASFAAAYLFFGKILFRFMP